jgi:hypothetical protein
MNTIVVALVMAIVANLAGALIYVILDAGKHADRAVKALTWEVCLSATLFFFVMIGSYFGWIADHPVTVL